MPELAEVKLMSDYINKHSDKVFTKISKSPESKVSTNLEIPFSQFKVKAVSRGKELLLTLVPDEGDSKNLRVTLGMSGNWKYYNPSESPIKHVHLFFEEANGNRLGMADVRRFAKWTWSDFNSERGPDPLSEYEKFSKNVLDNYQKSREFKKPVCEVLMNQTWFNGIGNYLRAEILYRWDESPFQKACEVSSPSMERLLKLCNQCVSEAYILGGGQLKDWKNPDGTDPSSFKEWMKCYYKLEKMTDKSGRTFWFDSKWL